MNEINFSLVCSILALNDFQSTLSQCLDGGLQAQDLLLSILKNCVEYGMEKVSNTKGMFNLFQVSSVFCQRYTHRVLQTIQMKLILLCVWEERVIWAVLK